MSDASSQLTSVYVNEDAKLTIDVMITFLIDVNLRQFSHDVTITIVSGTSSVIWRQMTSIDINWHQLTSIDINWRQLTSWVNWPRPHGCFGDRSHHDITASLHHNTNRDQRSVLIDDDTKAQRHVVRDNYYYNGM